MLLKSLTKLGDRMNYCNAEQLEKQKRITARYNVTGVRLNEHSHLVINYGDKHDMIFIILRDGVSTYF